MFRACLRRCGLRPALRETLARYAERLSILILISLEMGDVFGLRRLRFQSAVVRRPAR